MKPTIIACIAAGVFYLQVPAGAAAKGAADLPRRLDAMKDAHQALQYAVPKARHEVYQAVVDGVRYSMLLHIPGGAPEALVSKTDGENAKPDLAKPSGPPLPGIPLKKLHFLFEPVK